jgi:hypothetical protein
VGDDLSPIVRAPDDHLQNVGHPDDRCGGAQTHTPARAARENSRFGANCRLAGSRSLTDAVFGVLDSALFVGSTIVPMQAESLEVLENASVAPAQARAIVRAIELEIAGASDTLATKHDVLALHQSSDVLRAELRGEMATLAAQLRAEMAQLAAELRGDMTKLAAELRGDMTKLSAELRVEMEKLASELRKDISGVTRQMYVALLGQTAVLLGFFYFFLTALR